MFDASSTSQEPDIGKADRGIETRDLYCVGILFIGKFDRSILLIGDRQQLHEIRRPRVIIECLAQACDGAVELSMYHEKFRTKLQATGVATVFAKNLRYKRLSFI